VVKVKSGQPLVIKADTAFGAARFPDGETNAFGTHVYKTKAYKEGGANVLVEADVAFGELVVVEEK
jgi:hypothetical protein